MSHLVHSNWKTNLTTLFLIFQAAHWYYFQEILVEITIFFKLCLLVLILAGKALTPPYICGFSRPLGKFLSCMQGFSLRTPFFWKIWSFWDGFLWVLVAWSFDERGWFLGWFRDHLGSGKWVIWFGLHAMEWVLFS